MNKLNYKNSLDRELWPYLIAAVTYGISASGRIEVYDPGRYRVDRLGGLSETTTPDKRCLGDWDFAGFYEVDGIRVAVMPMADNPNRLLEFCVDVDGVPVYRRWRSLRDFNGDHTTLLRPGDWVARFYDAFEPIYRVQQRNTLLQQSQGVVSDQRRNAPLEPCAYGYVEE